MYIASALFFFSFKGGRVWCVHVNEEMLIVYIDSAFEVRLYYSTYLHKVNHGETDPGEVHCATFPT